MLSNAENIALHSKLANFLIVLRAEIVTIFEPKVVTISARSTVMRKFANFLRLFFSTHYNSCQPNFGILLLSKGFFREFRSYCPHQKFVYNANCPIVIIM